MVTARKRAAGRTAQTNHREHVGAWAEVCLEPIFGFEGDKYALSDVCFRGQFKLAMEGDLPAIRMMLKMLKANVAERDRKKASDFVHFTDRRSKSQMAAIKGEAAADPALLILGICAIDNWELTYLGQPGEPGYDDRLKALRPNRIAQWVYDFAMSRPDHPVLTEAQEDEITNLVREDDAIALRQWQARRTELLAGFMRLRGPGATQFKPGTSPNARGRPRQQGSVKSRSSRDDYPHDSFFMEPVVLSIGGKERTLTRLDALMCNLVMKASKGDVKIGRLIAPILASHREQMWFDKKYLTVEFAERRG